VHDTDSMPISGEPDLSVEERHVLRKLIRDHERSSWLWQGVRTYFPWVTTICGMLSAFAYWFVTEVINKHSGGQ
jgi:hypothetical protein